MRLREREVTQSEVGQLLKDMSGGRALRLYRGKEVLCSDDGEQPRIEAGDMIVEIVRS